MAKNKRNDKHNYRQASALLPAPLKCDVCGRVTHTTCPGCGLPVCRGCDRNHDCRGWQDGGE